MKVMANQVFGKTDSVLEETLTQRLAKQNIIVSNLANAYTPGYRALGFEFESQLRTAIGNDQDLSMRATNDKHVRNPGLLADGTLKPDLFVKPIESIGTDGNTVDVDKEMAELSSNQILYKTTIELLNRRLGMLRYGINGGR